eukprot:gene9538-10525_t
MAFGLYSLLEAILLVVNAMAVLNEERFLSKIGWGTNQTAGFGEEPGMKQQSEKGFRGRLRESIVTTLNKDITRSRSINRDFEMRSLKTKEDFELIRSKAQDRNDWRRISEVVCKAAEAEAT